MRTLCGTIIAAAVAVGIGTASVAVTSRNTGKFAVYDFSDQDNPKLLRAYELSGNPDLAAFWRGRVIVPAGHQGLIMESANAVRQH